MANKPDLDAEGVEQISSAALENAHQIATAQAILYGFDGRNTDGTNPAFIMVFDKASAAVSGTDIPKIVINVASSNNFAYSAASSSGIKFKSGIYILGSSTDFNGSTFTILASNKLFFHVEFAMEDGLTNPA